MGINRINEGTIQVKDKCSHIILQRRSILGKATKDSALIDGLSKFLKIHICNGQVVFNRLDLRWNGAELAAGSLVQIYNKEWVIRKGDCRSIGDNYEIVAIVLGNKLQQLLLGNACVLRVINKFHVRPKTENANRLLNYSGDRLPGGSVREVGAKDQRVFCFWNLLHEIFLI